LAGDVIPGADGARKVRWTVAGQGKRGGARVIYFNLTEQGVVVLVALYVKASKPTCCPERSERQCDMNIEEIALAIEADFGETLPELRQALAEAQSGIGRITTPTQLLVRQARERSGLTQQGFAERIATPVATLRDWEQGRFVPPGGVLCLMRLIAAHPELALELEAA
jgi:putative transcriptional regulator